MPSKHQDGRGDFKHTSRQLLERFDWDFKLNYIVRCRKNVTFYERRGTSTWILKRWNSNSNQNVESSSMLAIEL